MDKQYAGWLRIAVVAVGLYFASQMTAIYLPIMIAVVLSFILNPVVEFFVRLRFWPGFIRIPRGLAVIVAIIVFFLAVAGVMTFIFTPLIGEFNRFFANLPLITGKIQHLSAVFEQQAGELQVPHSLQSLVDEILSGAASYAVSTGQQIMNFILGFASQLVALVMVPVLTFYFTKDWRFLRDSFVSAMPPAARGKTRTIIHEMAGAMSSYLHGQAIVNSIMGLFVFSGMYLLGVDYPLVLGLLAMLTETIPYVGPIVGAVPAIFLAYLSSPALALKVTIFYLIIHQVENQILVPKVMGKTVDLHPVIVIFAMLAGGHFFGIVGMIVAVPLAALVKVLFKQLWHYE